MNGLSVFNRNRLAGAIFGLVLAGSFGLSRAAEIEVSDLGSGKPTLVTIVGRLEDADDVRFARQVQTIPKAIVILKSPGGNLNVGLSIGAQIRIKGYATWVGDNNLCASACALAWLGGERRYMSSGSLIGFHAAYVGSGEFKRESGMGNAIVGAYLNEIGLTLDAIKFITFVGPDELMWLDPDSARKLGIEVRLLDSDTPGQARATSSG